MYKIIKRDGKEVEFDLSKISELLRRRLLRRRESTTSRLSICLLSTVSGCEQNATDGKVDVEAIQDSVEGDA